MIGALVVAFTFGFLAGALLIHVIAESRFNRMRARFRVGLMSEPGSFSELDELARLRRSSTSKINVK